MAYHTIHIHHNDGMRTESIFAFSPHIFRVVPSLVDGKKKNPKIYADNVLLLLAGMKNSTVVRAVVTVMVVARGLI